MAALIRFVPLLLAATTSVATAASAKQAVPPAQACPGAAFVRLQAATCVEALAWSGQLPQTQAALTAFVQQHGQWTLAARLSRLRQSWLQRLGFDPLDAAAIERAGMRADAGVLAVFLRGHPMPLLVVDVADAAAFRAARLAELAEDEGPGEFRPQRTARGAPWLAGYRRFGATRRPAGAHASLTALGSGAVVLAPAGSEAALVALLDGLAEAGAAVPSPWRCLAPTSATAWQRRAGAFLGDGAVTAEVAFVDQAAYFRATGPCRGPACTPAAGSPIPREGPELTADVAPGWLMEARLAAPGPLLAGIDFARLANGLGGAWRRDLPQALAPIVDRAMRPWAGLQAAATQPLLQLARRHGALGFIRAFVGDSKQAGPLAPAVGMALRLDGVGAKGALARQVALLCPAAQKGRAASGALRCTRVPVGPADPANSAYLASPARRGDTTGPTDATATVLRPAAKSGGGGPADDALVWAVHDRWLLVANDALALTRLLASLPVGAPDRATQAGTDATAAPFPAAWLAHATPLRGSGAVSLLAAADVAQAALRRRSDGALAQTPLGLLPQLLLAGPVGDWLRELAALDGLQLRLGMGDGAWRLVGRLGPAG